LRVAALLAPGRHASTVALLAKRQVVGSLHAPLAKALAEAEVRARLAAEPAGSNPENCACL
jgi:hypothetical protein